MTDGISSLWSEVVRRAVMDAQGKGPVIAYNNRKHDNTRERKAEYRQSYREGYRRAALYFINGGGNWEMACDCLGRHPKEYTNEIMGELHGNRRAAKRYAPVGRRFYKKPVASGLDSGAKRVTGKESLSENLEIRTVAGNRKSEKHMAPAACDLQGLQRVSFAGDPAGAR